MPITIFRKNLHTGRALGNTAFQRAVMNAMGSDYIREVNVVKSAVLVIPNACGVYAYFIEHKQHNTLIWLPTDGDPDFYENPR